MARGLGIAIAMPTKMSPGFSHTLATNRQGPPPLITPAPLTYRDSHGDLVDLPTVAATRVKNEFGAVLEQALRGGAVAITRHDTPKAVLIAYDEFEALVRDRASSLHDLHAEYDVLLARMQTPAAKHGMAAAFDATPAQLGRAAVKAARSGRKAR